MPRISVLMPAYNAENYIAEAIDSILAQTFTDWELIILNDGSTDNTKDIINGYSDTRIKYYENTVNKGPIYTRLLMIGIATSQYFAFLDSDDVAMPQRLAKQLSFLDKNPDYAFCGTWGQIMDKNNKPMGKINMPFRSEEIRSALVFNNIFVHSSIMIRKEILMEESYDETFPVVEDYDLWCRLTLKYKAYNVPENLIRYRWYESNTSSSKADLMDKMAKVVFVRQLSHLGIQPSEDELSVHAAIRDKQAYRKSDDQFFKELKAWFKKLLKANSNIRKYDKNIFAATICFRWIFACKERHAYSKLFSVFSFIQNPIVGIKLLGLLYDRIR